MIAPSAQEARLLKATREPHDDAPVVVKGTSYNPPSPQRYAFNSTTLNFRKDEMDRRNSMPIFQSPGQTFLPPYPSIHVQRFAADPVRFLPPPGSSPTKKRSSLHAAPALNSVGGQGGVPAATGTSGAQSPARVQVPQAEPKTNSGAHRGNLSPVSRGMQSRFSVSQLRLEAHSMHLSPMMFQQVRDNSADLLDRYIQVARDIFD